MLCAGLQLEASGTRQQIEADLARKLAECGWRGRDNVTADELVHLISPAGRASVPDGVKADMLAKMKAFVQSLEL